MKNTFKFWALSFILTMAGVACTSARPLSEEPVPPPQNELSATNPPSKAEDDVSCDSVDTYKSASSRSFFIPFGNDSGAPWQESQGKTTEPIINSATLWSVQETLMRADLELSTPSGDWYQVLRYCYRLDGTLEQLDDTLNTQYGNVRVKTITIFDLGGKEISSHQTAFSLTTDEVVTLEEGSYMDQEPPLYLQTKTLWGALGFTP